MEIINVGLGRTGTTSLKLALERLGRGPCFHMFDIANSEERQKQWEPIVRGDVRPDWQALFDGYRCGVDGPCAVYYQQLIEAFPTAKIILTVRDARSWYRSTFDTLYQFVLANRDRPEPERPRMYRIVNTMVWDGLFEGCFEDENFAIEMYERHTRQVIDAVHPDNLLVYDVAQGWNPLCAFLGVDPPVEDFPRANDRASMRKVIDRTG